MSRIELRLSILFGLQFAIPGAWLPSLFPLLSARGLSVDQIGVVMAASGIGALCAPFYAGQLADRVLRADRLLGVFLALGALLLVALARAHDFGAVLASCLGIGLVFAPTIGLANHVCLSHLGSRERFGPVRMWGTVGWVASGILVAQWLLYRHGVSGPALAAGRVDAVWLAGGLSLTLALFCWTALPPTPPIESEASFAPRRALALFGRPPLLPLVLAALLLACVDRFFLFHGADYLSRFSGDEPGALERVFGAGGTGLFALGQLTEIFLLGAFPFLAARIPRRAMLITAAALFTLRMAVFAWVDVLPIVLVAVALHGFCFTFLFFVGFLVVDEVCPTSVRASGQALFQLVYGGIGALAGSLIAGRVGAWAQTGSGALDPVRLFVPPMLVALAATVLLAVLYPRRATEP